MVEREQWKSKYSFLLSLIGMSIGMGNVWRFPYVVYDNGGGAFMIPYATLTIIVGRPMYLLELALGQFSGYGQAKSFDGYPAAKGVGWAMVYACVLLSSFNSLVLAYVLIFLYYSATWSTLPWTECGRDWTDDRCYVKSAGIFSCRTLERMVLHLYKHDWLPEAVTRRQLGEVNATDVYVITSDDFGHCINATEVSSQQFFYKRVLGFNSQGKEEEDQPSYQGHLFLAVTVGWCCVFACVHNGVRSLGKVIYITTVLTFMLFSILLTRVLTLPGASVGLQQYLVPKWKAMLSLTLWRRAAEQVLFSLCLGYGTVICSAGFGRIRNRLQNDVNVIVATQFFASFGFGLIAFSVFGFLADSLETHVEDVVTCGFDIAFVAFPEAMSRVSNAHLWLVCFYATLFFMVLNAQCGTVLAVMTPIRDEYAGLLPRRWLWAVVGCLGPMLLALPMMRQDGIYTMKMCEEFMGQLLLPILALLEICFVAHGYGLLRFSHDICFMVKKWPPFLIKFLWKYICPAILSGLCCFNAVLFRKLEIGEHNLPGWTVAVGVLIVLAGLAIVAFFCVYHFYLSEWDCEAALKVSEDWGPRDPDERLRYHAFLKSQGFGRVVSLSEDTAQEAGSQHDSVSLEGNEGGKRSRDAPQPSHADSTVPHNPPAGPAVDPVDVPPTSASSPSGSHVAAVPSPKRTLVVSTSGVIVANVPPSETHDQLPDSNHL